MKVFALMVKRNIKLFFKDKGMALTALITPIILLVLYVAFLGKVYRESIISALPDGLVLSDSLINGIVGGQLFSSIIAVSCVTIAFCSNLIMVQDKITHASDDFAITPLKKSILALSYFVGTVAVTMLIIIIAVAACFVYLACVGWYLSFVDVLLILADSLLLILFGTSLAVIVNFSLKTNGQGTAVGTVVSAGYGFICGAYMPIASFGSGLQKVLCFFPGTYGTSLIRNHAMGGAFNEMKAQGVPVELIEGIKDSIDCNLYFFGKPVSIGTMYLILVLCIILFIAVIVLLNHLVRRKTLKTTLSMSKSTKK